MNTHGENLELFYVEHDAMRTQTNDEKEEGHDPNFVSKEKASKRKALSKADTHNQEKKLRK